MFIGTADRQKLADFRSLLDYYIRMVHATSHLVYSESRRYTPAEEETLSTGLERLKEEFDELYSQLKS